MDKYELIVTLEELKDFLRSIGCGEIYGTLGHDAGGILSHSVLHNDPCCKTLVNGIPETCNLDAEDEAAVTQVWEDMNEIIDRGRENQFVEKLEAIVKYLKSH